MIKALVLAMVFAVLFIAGIIVSVVFDAADKLAAVLHKTVKCINSFAIMQRKYALPGLQLVFLR